MNKISIHVSGMHCKSCEKLLEDEISNLPDIKEVNASQKEGVVEIFYEGILGIAPIKNIIEKSGYKIKDDRSLSDQKNNDWIKWFRAILFVLAIFFVWRVFESFGFLDKFNMTSPSLNYGVSFLVGLVASVSSCLAVVGGLVIAFAEKYKTRDETFFYGALAPNLIFHAGRLLTFFLLGGFLGLIGGQINISGVFLSAYYIIIAFVMGWLGLNILGMIPPISSFGIAIPKRLTGRWQKLSQSENKLAPFSLGLLSFFLPCGFTQSMQILALASGSFSRGALGLLFFALGTTPALLVLGVTASWTRNKKIEIMKKAAGIIVVIFAVYTFNSGLALKNVRNNVFAVPDKSRAEREEKKPVESGNIQTVEMHITRSGFQPSALKIKKNIPVQWVIYGDAVSGCTNEIIIPSLNIRQKIASGKNVINFTPDNLSKEIPFSCWMGMVRGKFITI